MDESRTTRPTYDIVDPDDSLVRRAGALTARDGLGGYDAIQLAAALEVRGAGADLEFVSFDRRLSHAASRERLLLLPVPPPG